MEGLVDIDLKQHKLVPALGITYDRVEELKQETEALLRKELDFDAAVNEVKVVQLAIKPAKTIEELVLCVYIAGQSTAMYKMRELEELARNVMGKLEDEIENLDKKRTKNEEQDQALTQQQEPEGLGSILDDLINKK